jgi:hypothetical protein
MSIASPLNVSAITYSGATISTMFRDPQSCSGAVMKRYLIERGVGGVSLKQPSEAGPGGFFASRITAAMTVIDSMTAMS